MAILATLGIKSKGLMHTRQTFVHWAQPQSLGLKFKTRISDAQFHLFPNACIVPCFSWSALPPFYHRTIVIILCEPCSLPKDALLNQMDPRFLPFPFLVNSHNQDDLAFANTLAGLSLWENVGPTSDGLVISATLSLSLPPPPHAHPPCAQFSVLAPLVHSVYDPVLARIPQRIHPRNSNRFWFSHNYRHLPAGLGSWALDTPVQPVQHHWSTPPVPGYFLESSSLSLLLSRSLN